MFTRIRAHNFHTLVDFEFRPRSVEVLAGGRGSGRSSLFHVLDGIDQLLSGKLALDEFPHHACTAWTGRAPQSFEVEIATGDKPYVYTVTVEHGSGEYDTWLTREELRQGDDVLFTFAGGMARLHVADGSFTRIHSGNGEKSALHAALAQSHHEDVAAFLDWWRDLWIVHPSPDEMHEYVRTDKEVSWPGCGVENFAPWYEHATRTDAQAAAALVRELAEVLDGFAEFRAVESDERSHQMQAVFEHPTRGTLGVGLEQLSQGERALIQLYSLIHLGLRPGRVLCIDAPAAHIDSAALRRWLERLGERARQAEAQVLVVIDDPAVIDQVPAGAITRFERHDAITRIRADR